MEHTGESTVRTWAAFGGIPIALALTLFGLYRSPAFGENSDPVAWGLLLVLSAAAIWLGRPGAGRLLQSPMAQGGTRSLTVLALGALFAYLVVARLVLDAFPNSGDEIAYVMQAETYGRGGLWVDLPPDPDALRLFRFFDVRGHWLSQYPPGWALVLALFAAIGAPLWIVNPAIGAAILVLFHTLARRHVGAQVAWLATVILATSAFYVLTVASFFNHALTTLLALVFALFAERFLERGRWRDAALAGLAIGALGVTRTQNAAPFVAAFLLVLAFRPGRRLGVVWFGLGGAPLLLALLAYNAVTTGDPLLPPQNWAGDEPLGPLPQPPGVETGGGSGPEPLGQIGLQTVVLTINRLVRLHEWGSPVVLYASIAAFLALARRRAVGLTDWIAPITIVMFLAYGGDGGNQYGPRYYFEAWPFALLTAAKLADSLLASPDNRLRDWTAAAIGVALTCQLAYLAPRLEREHRVVIGRQDVYRVVQAAGLKRAIVVIEGQVGLFRRLPPADLVRNGLDVIDRDIVYARVAPGGDAALTAAYPGRPLYTYRAGRLTPRGS